MSKRSFTIIEIKSKDTNINKKVGGRFISKTPMNAAKKAFSKVLNKNKEKYFKMILIIKETTKDSKKKTFTYKLSRVFKKIPEKIKIEDKEIIYNYDVFTKFVPEPKEYRCSIEEKTDKKSGFCCSKMNTINKRTFESCQKHLKRMNKN